MLDSLLDRLARQRGIGDAYHNYRGELLQISDADWQVLHPGLPGANNSVLAVAYDSATSKLYVGGEFTAIGSVLAPPSPTVPFEKVTSSGAQSHFFAATRAAVS